MHARSPLEPLPIPGVVLGGYPERRSAGATNAGGLWRRLREYLPVGQTGLESQALHQEVAACREVFEPLSDASFQLIIDYLRKQLFHQGCERGPQAAAMACVGEAARRTLGWVPFPTQLTAARIVLQNRLAEMHTGEGKTFAIAIAASVAAMAGIPVHVITSNEYLVARDAALFEALYRRLGLSVGQVLHGQEPAARRQAYACDVTYCTAKELAFDYLKDGLSHGRARHDLQHRVGELTGAQDEGSLPLLRGLCMAIVDEADSILIDEAGTPLILARALQVPTEVAQARHALRVARNLRVDRHFILRDGGVELTETARTVLEKLATGAPSGWRDPRLREELATQALRALHCYERDRHYVVREDKICIIDQTTGRLAEGRAWSRGLHQLVELKEGCAPSGRQETLAQITYQRFFPRYLRLGGTSGTLTEARGELRADYDLAVSKVPLKESCRRRDLGLMVVRDEAAKWHRVMERVRALRAEGRPVLIGTDSVAASERLALHLDQAGIAHAVLNAQQDSEESRIVAGAGDGGRVTVTTNMAGRGTDIALAPGVAQRGGLHVINCQLNSESRIDRQLYGRAARQGDPGSCETLLSLDEPLLSRRLPAALLTMLRRTFPTDQGLPPWLARAIVHIAQRREEMALRAARRDLIRRDAMDERRLALSGGKE